ncbi:MAG: MogA/MoaB family molybdenum cofactor biosynthesis protein [Aeromicrobium sp.]
MKAAVITCSDRSAAGVREDVSGALLVTGLKEAGYDTDSPVIVADSVEAIRDDVRAAVDAGADVVLTTGGTGLAPTDVTPEAVQPLLERQIPGIAEALRSTSSAAVPTSILSRGIAGTIGLSVVVTLPGSPGGVRDGLAVLLPVLPHLHAQLAGGDHPA